MLSLVLLSVCLAQVVTGTLVGGQVSGMAMSSDGTKLVASVVGGMIYTSTDSGATWTARADPGSRGWTDVAMSSDGSTIAAIAFNEANVWTSTHGGNQVWVVETNPAQTSSPAWSDIAMSDDGQITVMVGNTVTATKKNGVWSQTNVPSFLRSVRMTADGSYMAAMTGYHENSGTEGAMYISTDMGLVEFHDYAGACQILGGV